MFTLVCPRCQKNSYSSDEESFFRCPYCGFKFSGRYGPDKRREERVQKELPFNFSCEEENVKATTMNFSEKGLSIKIFNDPQIAVGNIIELLVGDLQIKAEVIWVNILPQGSLLGLHRLN